MSANYNISISRQEGSSGSGSSSVGISVRDIIIELNDNNGIAEYDVNSINQGGPLFVPGNPILRIERDATIVCDTDCTDPPSCDGECYNYTFTNNSVEQGAATLEDVITVKTTNCCNNPTTATVPQGDSRTLCLPCSTDNVVEIEVADGQQLFPTDLSTASLKNLINENNDGGPSGEYTIVSSDTGQSGIEYILKITGGDASCTLDCSGGGGPGGGDGPGGDDGDINEIIEA